MNSIDFTPSDAGAVALLSVFALLAGCSSNDDDDDGNVAPAASLSADGTVNGTTTAPLPGTAVLTSADLAGTWSTGCVLDDTGDPADGYEIDTISFTGEEFTVSAASYSDAGCTAAVADDDDVDLGGTYTLGDAVLTTEGMEATEIDFSAELPAVTGAEPAAVTFRDLVHVDGDILYLGEGDFDDVDDATSEPRPDSLDLDDPFPRQP